MTKNSLNSRPSENLTKIYKRLYSHYGPQGWWPGRSRLEVIVGAILTQNTAWSNVEKAIKALRSAGCLSSARELDRLDDSELAGLIRPAGYYNVKTKRLKNFTRFLYREYAGDLSLLSKAGTQHLRQMLMDINGIGPETCDSILLYAFARPVFVVDAYTKRIFSRHGLFSEDAFYEQVQAVFRANLPSDVKIFNEFHALIVRLAKEHCKKTPVCEGCPLKGINVVAKKIRR